MVVEGMCWSSRGLRLNKEFFEKTCFEFQNGVGTEDHYQRVYEALSEGYLLKKKGLWEGKNKLLGEISAVSLNIEKNRWDEDFSGFSMNAVLGYYPIFLNDGTRAYRCMKELRLGISNPSELVKLIVDKEQRTDTPSYFQLPPKYFLEKPGKP